MVREDTEVLDRSYTREELEKGDSQNAVEDAAEDFPSPIAGRMTGSMEQLERIQIEEGNVSPEVKECLKDCLDCYQACTETLAKCLVIGGEHAKLEHVNLLIDCAKMCSTNAEFMLRNSSYYPQICSITADISDECSYMCDRFEEDFMKECSNVCRRCSDACREIAR